MKLFTALLVALTTLTAARSSAQDAEELTRELLERGDSADVGTIGALADLGTREALEGLLEAYDVMQSVYARRAVLRALAKFDRHPELSLDAVEHVANVATDTPRRELRLIALDVLAGCENRGRPFLARIVESPADDEVRELALQAHVGLGDASDHAWYEELYRRAPPAPGKKVQVDPRAGPQPHPLPALRRIAFDALASGLDEQELVRATTDPNAEIRRRALEELDARGAERARTLAEELYEDLTAKPADRLAAARILYAAQGSGIAKRFLKDATRNDPREEFAFGLADLLAGMDDDGVRKELLRQAGKGKGQNLVFSLRAARALDDPKYDKVLLKVLRGKDELAAREAMRQLAERRDEDALDALEKIVERSDDAFHVAQALGAIGAIRGRDAAWLERLAEYARAEETDVRNGALAALAATEDGRWEPLFLEALAHPDWSTRLAAAHGLEILRTKPGVGALALRVQHESGRLAHELGEILFRLTGKPYAANGGIWADWWENEQDRFELVSAAELRELRAAAERRALRQVTTSAFFGIEIVSHRVLFVIDVSGSMNELTRGRYVGEDGDPRIDVAKRELIRALEALEPGSFFNVVVFSGGVSSWADQLTEWNEETLAEAKTFVERLGAGGGTNLFGALEVAFEDGAIDTVYVLSDGEPSVGEVVDPSAIRRIVAQRNELRGLVFHTIAVGERLRILEWLAEDSGGTCVRFQ